MLHFSLPFVPILPAWALIYWFCFCCFCSLFPLITHSYFLTHILSRIQAKSVHHLCGSITPPAYSCFLAGPKLELEARRPPRSGDLCSHRDALEQKFLHHCLPCRRSSLPPPHDAIAARWSMELWSSTQKYSYLSTAKMEFL